MTPKELIEKMRGLSGAIGAADVLYVATGSTMSLMAERVWGEGGLSSGGRISYKGPTARGYYFYAPPFPKKGRGRGKRGARTRGTWAPSYLDAKRQIGRGETPFELTGDLRKDWLGGLVPTPTAVTPYLCRITLSQKSADKASGLAESKGEFLKLTDAEIEAHHRHVAEAYQTLVLDKW